MGTHLIVLSWSDLMNTNKTGFRCFSKIFVSVCALDKSSLRIERVKLLSRLNQDDTYSKQMIALKIF